MDRSFHSPFQLISYFFRFICSLAVQIATICFPWFTSYFYLPLSLTLTPLQIKIHSLLHSKPYVFNKHQLGLEPKLTLLCYMWSLWHKVKRYVAVLLTTLHSPLILIHYILHYRTIEYLLRTSFYVTSHYKITLLIEEETTNYPGHIGFALSLK